MGGRQADHRGRRGLELQSDKAARRPDLQAVLCECRKGRGNVAAQGEIQFLRPEEPRAAEYPGPAPGIEKKTVGEGRVRTGEAVTRGRKNGSGVVEERGGE